MDTHITDVLYYFFCYSVKVKDVHGTALIMVTPSYTHTHTYAYTNNPIAWSFAHTQTHIKDTDTHECIDAHTQTHTHSV